MSDKSSITELDFFGIKEELKTYLRGQSRFQDYDFEGSNMAVLLDILAYNTFKNNFYTNMAMTEMFLDSAQLRNSVVSHAKELNYLPRSIRASRASIMVDFPNIASKFTQLPNFVKIPAYTKFIGRKAGKTFIFTNDDEITIFPDVNNEYCYTGLFVYEGRVLSESFSVTENDKQRFIISNENVDIDSIRVRVKNNNTTSAPSETYTLRDSLFGVNSDDKVYFIQPALDGKYEVQFGQDTFGYQPKPNEVVEVTYRVTQGKDANNINTFSCDDIIFDGVSLSPTITTVSTSEGGADQESIESIRKFAPKAFQVQDRAITESDYAVLLKSKFPEIQTVSVYGGEELSPPRYGKVIVSVDVQNAEGASENARVAYANYLKERSPLSIEPVITNPLFMHVMVDTTVYLNTNTTSRLPNSVREDVLASILNYSDVDLNEFGDKLRMSRLIGAIDSSETSISSSETFIRAVIDIVPTSTIRASNYVINFKNELEKDHFSLLLNKNDYEPAIYSSIFTLNGNAGFLQDNGLGAIQFVTVSNDNTFNVINRNVGTVNYTTGEVNLVSLLINDYQGSAIKIYANTKSKNILAPKERILSIRAQDVKLKVLGIRD